MGRGLSVAGRAGGGRPRRRGPVARRQVGARHRLRVRRHHAASGRAARRRACDRLRRRAAGDRRGARSGRPRRGLSDRADFVQAPPGPLPFADGSFDVVFSKDALLHVPDKDAHVSRDLPRAEAGRRVCRQQLDDRHDGEPSPDMKAYVAAEGLVLQHGFAGALPAGDGARRLRRHHRDRPQSLVSRGGARRAGAAEGSALRDASRRRSATDYVDKNIRTWEAMQKVLDSGEHRPTHLRGWKPGETVAGDVEIGCGHEDGDARPGAAGLRQEGRAERRAARPRRKRGGSS